MEEPVGKLNGCEFNEKPELSKFPVIPSGVRKPFPSDMVTIPEALAPMGYQCAHYDPKDPTLQAN
jgi:hypothetical protein